MDGWRDIPSYEAGRIAGIPVRFDALYPLMPGAIALSLIGRNAPDFGRLVLFALIIIAGATLSILLHELGHSIAARRYNLHTREIRIGGFYGLASIEHQGLTRGQEIGILIAGPLTNAAIFVLLWMALGMPALSDRLYFDMGSLETMRQQNWLTSNSLRWLAYFNLGLTVFNLVPAFPLDGGRICRAYFSGKVTDGKLVKVIAYCGVFIGVWSFFGAAAFPSLFGAGILLIVANYAIAKGEVPPPD